MEESNSIKRTWQLALRLPRRKMVLIGNQRHSAPRLQQRFVPTVLISGVWLTQGASLEALFLSCKGSRVDNLALRNNEDLETGHRIYA